MKRVILLFVSLVVMAFQLLFAQSFTVKGKVIAEEGNEPLIEWPSCKRVLIMVITDIDGNYSIEIKGVAQATLVYSYIGMQQQQHVVTPQTHKLDITLKSDAQPGGRSSGSGLTEFVKKGTVTGSVSTVKSEKIESVPTAGFDQALQGQTPGLMVMSNSGEPSKAPLSNSVVPTPSTQELRPCSFWTVYLSPATTLTPSARATLKASRC